MTYTNPTVWLLAEKGDDAAPSQGRAIDHLGWAVTAVDAKVSDLAAKSLKTVEPRARSEICVSLSSGGREACASKWSRGERKRS